MNFHETVLTDENKKTTGVLNFSFEMFDKYPRGVLIPS